jgi:hypothetical protein
VSESRAPSASSRGYCSDHEAEDVEQNISNSKLVLKIQSIDEDEDKDEDIYASIINNRCPINIAPEQIVPRFAGSL